MRLQGVARGTSLPAQHNAHDRIARRTLEPAGIEFASCGYPTVDTIALSRPIIVRTLRVMTLKEFVIVCIGVLLSGFVEAGNYAVFISEKYQTLSRESTGPGLGFSVDASHHRADNAYAIGPGLGVSMPLGPISLFVGGKALYIRSSPAGKGLAIPLGVAGDIHLSDTMSIASRLFYTPTSAFNSRLGGYVQAGTGIRMKADPALAEVGWRYERIAGRNGASEQKILNGPYVGLGFTF
ncbi:hypothetical protein WL21_04645 [Burkholderia ubonensis]|uniref:YfaZ family outer membrane protein n=1 Tax=Burkholderia ubonensis TaxID=101571 RepID=UPI00075E9863|nr:YfaZ family outer membrane protein [Burkholderia ubonensis]KVZ57293.1 hypothetical protein WL20_23400 [Burkholderia ubonensis]KVZ72990.1 hypothetical protein WL21_04645 [Burkholderia ubonensis]